MLQATSLTARPEPKEESEGRRDVTVWDRVRAMPYAEKIILAPKPTEAGVSTTFHLYKPADQHRFP
jgi:hypothetical protein